MKTALTETALALATKAHEGQTRWDKRIPYITHPIAVAEFAVQAYEEWRQKHSSSCYSVAGSERDRQLIYAVALCHDIVEDCEGYTVQGVVNYFADRGLLNAQEADMFGVALNRLNKNNYPDYCEFALAAKEFWLSRFPKIGDITHNLQGQAKGSMKDKYLLALHVLNT